jgi:hypothetical protein
MPVTYEEARLLLLMHGSGTSDAEGQPLFAEDGFVCSLRPYRGLIEKNFHLVMEALFTVAETLHRSSHIERQLAHSLWSMCLLAKDWGLDPAGMLQRNKLISLADTKRLRMWVEAIESGALGLLVGLHPCYQIERYAQYIIDVGWWDNIDFFIGLMQRALADPEWPDPSVIVQALGKLGHRSAPLLPMLYTALEKRYSWYSPEDRCTEEVRSVIRQAIQSIEADTKAS